MNIKFLGGTGGVTGSRYLLESGTTRILIDCGLFQGLKELRLKNWNPLPVDSDSIDAVILTHAHLDHSGYIPKLVKEGFKGPIYSTEATRDLCKILLPDSGYLQEEEAKYRNKKGSTKHSPALALYTEREARLSIENFSTEELNNEFSVGPFRLFFRDAGHILGASSILITCEGKSIVFSGDLGRFDDLLMTDPEFCPEVDYVVMESTYGDRNHSEEDPVETLSNILESIIKEKGVLLIPSFAVGRAQTLLYLFHQVFEKFPDLKIPVFLNSPMATNVTKEFRKHIDEHKLNADDCYKVCDVAKIVNTMEESQQLDFKKGPMAIVSASGMLTGGRILHHIKSFGGNPRNVILLSGFQAMGTRGHNLSSGSRQIKIHGSYINIKAQVLQTHALSAHADQKDLLHWLSPLKKKPPKKVLLVHGEPSSSDALRVRIKDSLNFECKIPFLGESMDI